MKVSLQLLGNCQTSFDVSRFNKENIKELTGKIASQLGAVDGVENLAEKYQDCQVVRVVSCEKHPGADKLSVCKIDDRNKTKDIERDDQGYIQVVCGAPNVKEGLKVVWLPPGATAPSSKDKDPFKLEAREIRGVISYGMLASPSELGQSEDHSGILELDEDSEIGGNFATLLSLDDFIIDIENKMFTHRPDCFGHLGVARELAGIYGQAFKSPDWYKENPEPLSLGDASLALKVSNEVKDQVPRFSAVVISGVTIEPSPLWIQSFLSRVGIRPINNIVDLTNLFMIITAQPLHAYDYDKVVALGNGNDATLVVRNPKEGEKITLLGGKEVTPSDKTILIATDRQAIGIGGVMGGEGSEVDNSTKNIILESATFNMYSIRRTSMALGIFTEAVTRFTKGQSSRQNLAVLSKVAKEICDASGGKIASMVVDEKEETKEQSEVATSANFINERLGSDLTPEKISKILSNVEFEVSTTDDQLSIKAPFWRTDIEEPEDIVEEVGRLIGFDSLPANLPGRSISPAERDPSFSLKQTIEKTLSAMGANELLTYSFVHSDLLAKSSQDKEEAYQLSNALSPDLQYYRLSLLPSLIERVHPNIKAGFPEMALYELNPVHSKNVVDQETKLPVEDSRLALVFATDSKTAKQKYSGAAYYQAKKYLYGLMEQLHYEVKIKTITDTTNVPKEFKQMVAPFAEERLAEITSNNNQILGYIGEFKASVKKAFKTGEFLAGYEISLNKLQEIKEKTDKYRPISKYPYLEQDICFKVAADVSFQDITDLITKEFNNFQGDSVLGGISPVDIYSREEEKDSKQITLRISVLNYSRTMTDQEVSKLLDNLATVAKDQLKAERI